MTDYIEDKIAQVERDIYGGEMPSHNKAVMRAELRKEERFWEAWDVRKDSNRGRDDQ